ncbi:MAG: hypothetical protein DRP97_03020 [Candidatus Latescibacterota bacterium]|nr:MAG: hypothetical protein DRP97_03020 [Candidatus Latescibacterota bacterium]
MILELNEEEQARYDSWSKEDIYIAYVSATRGKDAAQAEAKRLGRVIAAQEYDVRIARQESFRRLVLSTIPTATPKDLDVFFDTKYEIVYIKKGYIGIQYLDGEMFIAFLYKGDDFGTIRAVYNYLKDKEVYYEVRGVNYYRNNSEQHDEDEDDIYRLKI